MKSVLIIFVFIFSSLTYANEEMSFQQEIAIERLTTPVEQSDYNGIVRHIEEINRITSEHPSAAGSGNRSGMDISLYQAVSQGHKSVSPSYSVNTTRLLLEQGANPKQVVKDGEYWLSVMEVAAKYANRDVMDFLLSQGEQPDQDQSFLIAIRQASMAGDIAALLPALEIVNQQKQKEGLNLISWMLDNGWSIEKTFAPYWYDSDNQYSPLMIAAISDNGPITDLLISRGANVNANTTFLPAIALAAAYNRNSNAFKLLLENGADINARINEEGETLLHFVARVNQSSEVVGELMQLLLNAGADPNALTTKRAYSPLAAAGMSGNVQAAKVLISAGADVNHQSSSGRTPLDISSANMKSGDENHYTFQSLVAQAGGRFVMNSPPAQPEEKSEDNFAAALVGGLTAAAVGYNRGMSETAAVDFGVSMAQDIDNENVSTQSFEATRFQANNAGKAAAHLNQELITNNPQNMGSSTNNSSRTMTPRPAVPQSSGTCRGTYPQDHVCARAGSPAWYAENQRNTAIGMARTIAFTDAAVKCDYPTSTPPQSDSSWIVSSPDCRESYGHTTDGTALIWCEIETSAPCTTR